MYKTRKEVKKWLAEMEIKNYVINEDLTKVNYQKIKRENELLKELSVNSNNVKLNKKL